MESPGPGSLFAWQYSASCIQGDIEKIMTRITINSRGKLCCRHRFGVPMIAHLNLFRVPMIDHRKRFGGEMIALLTGTFFRWSIIGKINRFAVHKSDHLPVKTFPMIDHLPAKPFPMIDHRKRFDGEMSDHLPVKTMSTAGLYPTVYFVVYDVPPV